MRRHHSISGYREAASLDACYDKGHWETARSNSALFRSFCISAPDQFGFTSTASLLRRRGARLTRLMIRQNAHALPHEVLLISAQNSTALYWRSH